MSPESPFVREKPRVSVLYHLTSYAYLTYKLPSELPSKTVILFCNLFISSSCELFISIILCSSADWSDRHASAWEANERLNVVVIVAIWLLYILSINVELLPIVSRRMTPLRGQMNSLRRSHVTVLTPHLHMSSIHSTPFECMLYVPLHDSWSWIS